MTQWHSHQIWCRLQWWVDVLHFFLCVCSVEAIFVVVAVAWKRNTCQKCRQKWSHSCSNTFAQFRYFCVHVMTKNDYATVESYHLLSTQVTKYMRMEKLYLNQKHSSFIQCDRLKVHGNQQKWFTKFIKIIM